MAERTRDIAQIIVSDYEGKTEKLWDDGASFDVIQKRLIKLPGFGKMKAQKMRFVLHYFGYRDLS